MLKHVVLLGSLLATLALSVDIHNLPKQISMRTAEEIIEEMMAQTGTVARK